MVAMETNINSASEVKQLPAAPAPEKSGGKTRWIIIIAALVIFALLITAFVFLLRADAATTAEIRDIFIIFMALILLLLMLSAVVLVIQLATLINLLQNEIKPMMESINETVNTVRGTTAFLSDNLVEPVIRVNEVMAGFKGVRDFFRMTRR
jgi:heme/copper-type cytochrome/quinol oxidase subunit 3